jgi:GxxExxY protein
MRASRPWRPKAADHAQLSSPEPCCSFNHTTPRAKCFLQRLCGSSAFYDQTPKSHLGTPDALDEPMPAPTAARLNATTSRIIEAAIAIHRKLGPGLLESAYLTCLTRDLAEARLPLETQRAIPLVYKSLKVECAYRADLVVDGSVLVEVKAIEAVAPIHIQQVYTYLRLGDYPVGLLLNFGARTMKAGIKRIVNDFPDR